MNNRKARGKKKRDKERSDPQCVRRQQHGQRQLKGWQSIREVRQQRRGPTPIASTMRPNSLTETNFPPADHAKIAASNQRTLVSNLRTCPVAATRVRASAASITTLRTTARWLIQRPRRAT